MVRGVFDPMSYQRQARKTDRVGLLYARDLEGLYICTADGGSTSPRALPTFWIVDLAMAKVL